MHVVNCVSLKQSCVLQAARSGSDRDALHMGPDGCEIAALRAQEELQLLATERERAVTHFSGRAETITAFTAAAPRPLEGASRLLSDEAAVMGFLADERQRLSYNGLDFQPL
jgi:hypothetical protein